MCVEGGKAKFRVSFGQGLAWEIGISLQQLLRCTGKI